MLLDRAWKMHHITYSECITFMTVLRHWYVRKYNAHVYSCSDIKRFWQRHPCHYISTVHIPDFPPLTHNVITSDRGKFMHNGAVRVLSFPNGHDDLIVVVRSALFAWYPFSHVIPSLSIYVPVVVQLQTICRRFFRRFCPLLSST